MRSFRFLGSVLAASLALASSQQLSVAQSQPNGIRWDFNDPSGALAHDSIGNIDDAIEGFFWRVPGVEGNGLQFDGYTTRILREAKKVPQLKGGFTVSAWVAPNYYPWNWVPIADQNLDDQVGFFFGIDAFGHPGFDIAIGAFPHSFGGVVDEPLCPLKRLLCASPTYLGTRGAPRHPRDLVDHSCLSFLPTGPEWIFDGPRGRITVQVRPLMSSNEGHVLLKSAIAGNGITLISHYLADDALRSGTLQAVLPDFPIPELWVKASIPERRINAAAVQALLRQLKESLSPVL